MASGNSMVFMLESFYTIIFSAIIIAQSASFSNREKVVEQKEKEIIDSFDSYSSLKQNLYSDLKTEFEDDLHRWNALIDKDNLSVQFFFDEKESPHVMFFPGSGKQTEYYDDLIKDFCPRYYKVLKKRINSSLIAEIKIEGHTSSEWINHISESEAYYNNLSLSQERSKNVMISCLRSIESLGDSNFLTFRKKMTANGASSSKIITNEAGQENTSASRRVEFKIVTSFDQNIENLNVNH